MILDPNDPAVIEYQKRKEKQSELDRRRELTLERLDQREREFNERRAAIYRAADEARRERNRIWREQKRKASAERAAEKANLSSQETQRNVRILREIHRCDQNSSHEKLRPLYLSGFRVADLAVACGIGIRAAQRRIFDKAKPKPNRLLTVPVDLT